MMGKDAPKRFQTAHAGHGQIHHDDIRSQFEKTLTGDFTRFRLGDHRHIGLRLQQQPKSHSDYRMVIHQQHANHALAVNGISAISRTPCGSCDLTLKAPPSRVTRSARPRRPKCPGGVSVAGMPIPSSATVTTIRCASESTAMSTREAWACRNALIKPSCTTR